MSGPNILFIFCDEMRWDCLGAAGNPVIRTPNLDRLAARGVRFANAWSTAPLCVPARAQLVTGMPPWKTGAWGLGDAVPPVVPTVADRVAARGYFAGAVGKMHFRPTRGGASMREPHGFHELVLSEECAASESLSDVDDDYVRYLIGRGYADTRYPHGRRSPDFPAEGYQAQVSERPLQDFDTVWTAREAARMVEARAAAEQPWMVWCSFVKPHFPCELPADWPCPYDPADIPLRGSWDPAPDTDAETFSFVQGAQRGAARFGWATEEVLRPFAAHYYGNITLIDQQVGELLDALEATGQADDTWIVFSSDHGECLGERGQMGKYSYDDESARIPMLVAGPGIESPGRVDERPVTLDDLFATFAEIAGDDQPPPSGLSRSLLPLLRDPQAPGRDAVFGLLGGLFHFEPDNAHTFVLADGWKYEYQFEGGRQKLFHVDADPLELDDRAADEPERCAAMGRRIAAWLRQEGAGFLARDGRLRHDLNVR